MKHNTSKERLEQNGVVLNRERRQMLDHLESMLGLKVRAYSWGFRRVHPAVLLSLSLVISQILHEVLLFQLFEAYGIRNAIRTTFEIVSPLTLWFAVDTAIQIALALFGIGHKVLVQTEDGRLLVFERQLLNSLPARLIYSGGGSLAMSPQDMGFVIDRLHTPFGKFYVWGRWRDMRMMSSRALGRATSSGFNEATH